MNHVRYGRNRKRQGLKRHNRATHVICLFALFITPDMGECALYIGLSEVSHSPPFIGISQVSQPHSSIWRLK